MGILVLDPAATAGKLIQQASKQLAQSLGDFTPSRGLISRRVDYGAKHSATALLATAQQRLTQLHASTQGAVDTVLAQHLLDVSAQLGAHSDVIGSLRWVDVDGDVFNHLSRAQGRTLVQSMEQARAAVAQLHELVMV